jgi:hypothetical protein
MRRGPLVPGDPDEDGPHGPGGAQSATLSGSGLRPAALSATLNSASFGQVEVGVQSATTVAWNIMNTGDLSSSIPALSQTTSELQVSGNTCTSAIPAGGTRAG